MSCSQCSEPLRTQDVNLELGVAQCAKCGAVWELAARPARTERPAAVQPPGWTLSTSPFGLEQKWFSVESMFIIAFTVIWNGIMVMFAIGAISSGDPEIVATMIVFPHTWVGVALAWYCAATVLNSTRIAVDSGQLKVSHGPVWWPGALAVPVADLDQFYVEESSVRVNKRPRWNLAVLDKKGVVRVAVRLLKSPEEARWLEQRIEDALQIEDRAVPGQV